MGGFYLRITPYHNTKIPHKSQSLTGNDFKQETGPGPIQAFLGLPGRRIVACRPSFFAVFSAQGLLP
jgi:hypothetical protein